MSDTIIKFKSKNKKVPDQNATTIPLPVDNTVDNSNPNNYPTLVRLISSTCDEQRVFLPAGVHDVDKLQDYPEVVYNIVGGDLDSYNFTIIADDKDK